MRSYPLYLQAPSRRPPWWSGCIDTTTKIRRKRAPVAELESSANPQPGKAALRSARFPACGFWRLSSRQMVVLSRCARVAGDGTVVGRMVGACGQDLRAADVCRTDGSPARRGRGPGIQAPTRGHLPHLLYWHNAEV